MDWDGLVQTNRKILFHSSHGILEISFRNFWSNGKRPSVRRLAHKIEPRSTGFARLGLKYGKPNVAIFNSFNFISSFVFCIQLCVQYSTCIQHSTRYSIFNFPFNIQLFILYSILHSPIQLSVQQFQLFIQHSTLIFKTFNCSFNIQLFFQHSTIHSTFNFSFNIQLFTQLF